MYSFSKELAKEFGVDGAVLLNLIYLKVDKYYVDIYYLSELLPFWSERKIRLIIKKLLDNGAIEKKKRNRNSFDQKILYYLSDSIYNKIKEDEK